MSRTPAAFTVALFACAALTCAALSCGEARPAVSDDPGGNTSSGGASSSGGGGTSDGGSSTASSSSSSGSSVTDAGVCTVTSSSATEVSELSATGQVFPYGGVITEGTYVLVAMTALTVGDAGEGVPVLPTGKAARVMLRVTSTELTFIESRGLKGSLGPDTLRGATYTKGATSLELSPVCPTGAKTTVGFTAGGNALSLFTDATHWEDYTRLP